MENGIFHIYSQIYNLGGAAAGGYLQLVLPTYPNFEVLGADLYTKTSDGNTYFHRHYERGELVTTDLNEWRIPTGEVISNYPRLVRWTVYAPPVLGQFLFPSYGYYREKGAEVFAGSSVVSIDILPVRERLSLPFIAKE